MADDALIEAIKTGIKGEIDSVTIYEDAAANADGEVKAFFIERAEEEKRHHNWLLAYWRELSAGASPSRDLAREAQAAPGRAPIVSEDFLRRIGASRHLSAAVASAALLEANAIRHYAQAAEKAPAGPLREFLKNLSAWESRHFDDLARIQEESRRHWFDAHSFEPF